METSYSSLNATTSERSRNSRSSTSKPLLLTSQRAHSLAGRQQPEGKAVDGNAERQRYDVADVAYVAAELFKCGRDGFARVIGHETPSSPLQSAVRGSWRNSLCLRSPRRQGSPNPPCLSLRLAKVIRISKPSGPLRMPSTFPSVLSSRARRRTARSFALPRGSASHQVIRISRQCCWTNVRPTGGATSTGLHCIRDQSADPSHTLAGQSNMPSCASDGCSSDQ